MAIFPQHHRTYFNLIEIYIPGKLLSTWFPIFGPTLAALGDMHIHKTKSSSPSTAIAPPAEASEQSSSNPSQPLAQPQSKAKGTEKGNGKGKVNETKNQKAEAKETTQEPQRETRRTTQPDRYGFDPDAPQLCQLSRQKNSVNYMEETAGDETYFLLF